MSNYLEMSTQCPDAFVSIYGLRGRKANLGEKKKKKKKKKNVHLISFVPLRSF